jgi:CheY-like chemotaxis protein
MTTILIVDDDFDMRDSLVDILEDEGFDIAKAADGLEALTYLRAHPAPRLILLDWMMPRCDGANFRAQQRADPALADIPVVLLTADARVEEKVTALQVNDFLLKPVKLHRLLEVVRKYCGDST